MKRNKFSLSHYKLLSMSMGQLVPVGLIECLPGDTIQHSTSLLIRCAPMVTPPMHPVNVRLHHWFVPHRLVWENWEDFITGGPDGLNASVHPTRTFTTVAVKSLADYLGLPVSGASITGNALPFRGYQLIFNEWYRDQDLRSPINISTADGNDTTTSVGLRDVSWEKDYFTSARPWEQKGPAITIPLGTTAPVLGLGVENANPNANPSGTLRKSGGLPNGTFTNAFELTTTTGLAHYLEATSSTGTPNIRADLSAASAITINALREASALQRYEENRARYGSRYSEYLRVLGVRSADERLQRPEYLGGGRQVIQFSEVLQTAADGANPVGTMRGHGISAMRSNRYRRFIPEHGFIFSLLSVMPKSMYVNGQERHWNRLTKEDYYQRELESIGQQEVLNKELYAIGGTPDGVFGWQDRYDDYRRKWSGVAGEFATSVLNSWHFARDFGSPPALNSAFVEGGAVPERPFASSSNDVLYVMARHSIQARRLLSKQGKSRLL